MCSMTCTVSSIFYALSYRLRLGRVFQGRWRSAVIDRLCKTGIFIAVLGGSCSLSACPRFLISSESCAWLMPSLVTVLCWLISSLRHLLVRALDSSELTWLCPPWVAACTCLLSFVLLELSGLLLGEWWCWPLPVEVSMGQGGQLSSSLAVSVGCLMES